MNPQAKREFIALDNDSNTSQKWRIT